MSYVAFQYAEALYALALEEKQVDEVLTNFEAFNNAQDEDISKFLNHPKITKKNKKEVVGKAITNSLFKNFVFVLIDNSRIEYLDDCLSEFKVINDNQNKVMNVVVYSKEILAISDLNKLKNNLGMKHNRKVMIKNIVEPSIIGGLRIEYDGQVLDETINNHLLILKNKLTK
ncbi:ATP synthase subunit delta [Candidatus Izimaplasma bacterium HR1]|jgi:F-type H+-transporting ATPase subunit delta|uniref:ATP synthase F1 subunit delta n=1 Tax=Candidatus Izimoplasma sp. HR1 TaxID=1541959 RepID=UPI0004F7B3FD|nr:ATP synthase subunit delta [Candidatus Izimaplasma bacterium HR1]